MVNNRLPTMIIKIENPKPRSTLRSLYGAYCGRDCFGESPLLPQLGHRHHSHHSSEDLNRLFVVQSHHTTRNVGPKSTPGDTLTALYDIK